MMKFKKTMSTVVALSVALSVGAVFKTNEAKAGIVFLTAGAISTLNAKHQNNTAIGLGGILTIVGIYSGNAAVLILDADGSLSRDRIQDNFSKAFPFIDNTDVYAKMADVVKEKYTQNRTSDGSAKIVLSRDEVVDLLSPVMETLTAEQTEKVIQDLGPDTTAALE